MKVIYTKTIVEQIQEAKAEATSKGRDIERIELNDTELAHVFHHVVQRAPMFRRPSFTDFQRDVGRGQVQFYGVKLGLQK